MPDSRLKIEFFEGIHNDPRIATDHIIYSLGSYVSGELPIGLEYLYFTVTNTSSLALTLDNFYLEYGQPASDGNTAEPLVLWTLDLPERAIKGRRLKPGGRIALGFLRDLFTKRFHYMPELEEPFRFQAICTVLERDGSLSGGLRSCSVEYELDLNFPKNPLQDSELSNFHHFFERRSALFKSELQRLRVEYGSLAEYAGLHLDLGLHKFTAEDGKPYWRLREWMPAATELWLTTDTIGFELHKDYRFKRITHAGLWELTLPESSLKHGTYIELRFNSPFNASGEPAHRVPAFANWVTQNPDVLEEWCARVWEPAKSYKFKYSKKRISFEFPRIYEAHIGIAQAINERTEKSVGSFKAFTLNILPRVKAAGYTAVQLMGVLEHPLYKSFGYQVSSYFAPSSRFGTVDDFKELVDTAHKLGLGVILDIAHSHSAPNTEQGIARYDGSSYFFADKDNQWGTSSFDYSLDMTRRFLLSNCRYWMEEFQVDGFRFDAVGNMIYVDHGFGDNFSHVDRCFYTADGKKRMDEAGVLYLALANALIHELNPCAVSLAEEFSGMPGLTCPQEEGGLGFDYRFAMGIPDFWGKYIKATGNIGSIWHEMTNYRFYDSTVSYMACHDQCINGKDAMIWRLIGDDMYARMSVFTQSWKTSRGVALYKLMRLITLMTAASGYLNFMGDEFGHPEWIDAEDFGHRQWHLPERTDLKYAGLGEFDRTCLVDVLQKHLDYFKKPAFLRHLHEENRTLAFERGNLLFVFNFHETKAAEKLELWVKPGKYVEFISSDAIRFAGNGNLEVQEPPVEHFSQGDGTSVHTEKISVYVPPMVALVMQRL